MLQTSAIFAALAIGTTLPAADGDGTRPGIEELPAPPLAGVVRARFGPPTVIPTEAALKKIVADPAARKKLAAAVDFSKQSLLLFRWAGSGRDRLAYEVTKVKGKPNVVFVYKAGFTRDLRRHVKLFVVDKSLKWKTERRRR